MANAGKFGSNANGRPSFFARAAQIAVDTVKLSTSDYTENLVKIKDDAKEIQNEFNQGTNTAKEVFNDLRKNGMKKFVDWFYTNADGTSDYDFDNDGSESDFDAGFKLTDDIDSDKDNTPSKPKVLDETSMRDIAKGQVNAMYKIAGKQAETSVMGVSEIKNTIVHQSSIIAAAIKGSNDRLDSINQQLKTLVELQKIGIEQQSEIAEAQEGLQLDDGRFTLKTLTQGIKQAFSESFGDYVDMIKDTVGMGGPAGLLNGLIDITGVKDRIQILKRPINQRNW